MSEVVTTHFGIHPGVCRLLLNQEY